MIVLCFQMMSFDNSLNLAAQILYNAATFTVLYLSMI